MQYRHAQRYARALRRAVAGASDEETAREHAQRMAAAMRRRGHAGLMPATVREYRRMLARERATDRIIITAPDDPAAQEVIENLQTYRERLGAPADAPYEVRYADRLIGGAVVQYGSRRVDASYKRSLMDLYHRITAA